MYSLCNIQASNQLGRRDKYWIRFHTQIKAKYKWDILRRQDLEISWASRYQCYLCTWTHYILAPIIHCHAGSDSLQLLTLPCQEHIDGKRKIRKTRSISWRILFVSFASWQMAKLLYTWMVSKISIFPQVNFWLLSKPNLIFHQPIAIQTHILIVQILP